MSTYAFISKNLDNLIILSITKCTSYKKWYLNKFFELILNFNACHKMSVFPRQNILLFTDVIQVNSCRKSLLTTTFTNWWHSFSTFLCVMCLVAEDAVYQTTSSVSLVYFLPLLLVLLSVTSVSLLRLHFSYESTVKSLYFAKLAFRVWVMFPCLDEKCSIKKSSFK